MVLFELEGAKGGFYFAFVIGPGGIRGIALDEKTDAVFEV